MFFRDWLNEDMNGLIKLYHGGSLWGCEGPTIFPSKKGRYECGIGIYLTTKYDTARNYAKGGKVVLAVYIDSNFTRLNQVKLPVESIVSFVKSVSKMRKKQEIINDLLKFSQRVPGPIPLSVLNNLVVNHEAGTGEVGVLVNRFLVQNGVDLDIQNQSGEDWVVIFNTSIIKKWEKINPSKMVLGDYDLPRMT